MQTERRAHRSENPIEALTFQLAATAERTACTAIILTERSGLPCAEVGGDAVSEEIAALAPILVRDNRMWHGTVPTPDGDRIVTIAPIPSQCGVLYLCAVGGQICVLGNELIASGRGVVRILS